MRARFAIPAVFLLAACGGEKSEGTDTSAAMNPAASTTPAGDTAAGAAAGGAAGAGGGSLSDPSTVAQLDSVSTAAKAGLTTLPAAVAVPLIQSFESKLKASNDADLKSIGDDLGELREELGKSPVNGKEIGDELSEIGPKVTRAASKGGAAQSTLTAIGAELTKAGRSLKGGG
jgi:hypothetical protein